MTNAVGWRKQVKFGKRIPDPLFDLGACISSTLSAEREYSGKVVDEARMRLVLKAKPLKTKARLYCLWDLEPDVTETIDVLLNRLFRRARQSGSKGSSPADLLTLNNIKDKGGASIM